MSKLANKMLDEQEQENNPKIKLTKAENMCCVHTGKSCEYGICDECKILTDNKAKG